MQAIKYLGPTRTILITGFSKNEELDKFISLLPSDQLLENYKIPNTQFLFITFFDIRNSINFYENFKKSKNLKNLNFHYTIHKYEIPKNNEEANEKNKQSSLIIFFKNIESQVSDSAAMKHLQKFGEVKEIRMSKPLSKIVEYCNMKDAKKALDKLNNSKFEEGIIKCKFVWDIMQNVRAEYLKKTDDILKKLLAQKNDNFLENRKKLRTDSETDFENVFLNIFDKFIVENLSKIEEKIKNE